MLNPGVKAEPYNDTVEGAVIYLSCDYGYIPYERRMAVCQHNGYWDPEISSKDYNRVRLFVCFLLISHKQSVRFVMKHKICSVSKSTVD